MSIGSLFIPILLILLSSNLSARLPQKVIICGVCRDVEERLPFTQKIIEKIGKLFTNYRVIVYENNSSDHTVDILINWANTNTKVFIQSEFLSHDYLEKCIVNKNPDGSLFRPELIARARNIVLEKAFSKEYDDFPYIIWIDMDFAIFPELDGLIEIFTANREWDGVFAYGVSPSYDYWDWYALRYEKFPFGPELLGNDWYQMGSKRENSIALQKTSDWLPVYSAFGGCGVYKKSSIVGCQYSGLVTKDTEKLMRILIDKGINTYHPQALLYQEKIANLNELIKIDSDKSTNKMISNINTGIILHKFNNPVIWQMNTFTFNYPSICEHVPFHSSMILKGHDKLFINPRLIFKYGTP